MPTIKTKTKPPKIPLDEYKAQKKQETEQVLKQLEDGVKGVFTSEKYAEYLTAMSKFHNYSIRNILWITAQMPEASHVAGFNDWKNKHERSVKKGEKSMRILAPCFRKVEKTDNKGNPILDRNGKPIKEERLAYYKIVPVFDISQTEGKPLPTIAEELQNSVNGYKRLFSAIKSASPVPLEFEEIRGGAKGYYAHDDKKIVVNSGMSEAQNIKTGIHEISHAILHDKDSGIEKEADRRTREVQAESIAFVVCKHFGIDTSGYSFGYIAAWGEGRETPELKASLDVIRKHSTALITEIEERLEQSREIVKESPEPARDDIIANIDDVDIDIGEPEESGNPIEKQENYVQGELI